MNHYNNILQDTLSRVGAIRHHMYIQRLHDEAVAELRSMTTHRLMNMLNETRKGSYSYSVTAEDIKAELAKRPHIPNKEERRKRRRKSEKAS